MVARSASKSMTLLFLGGLVGAGAALLCAPASGEEIKMRFQVRRAEALFRLKQLKEELIESVAQFMSSL